jgi:hypothetical protein
MFIRVEVYPPLQVPKFVVAMVPKPGLDRLAGEHSLARSAIGRGSS